MKHGKKLIFIILLVMFFWSIKYFFTDKDDNTASKPEVTNEKTKPEKLISNTIKNTVTANFETSPSANISMLGLLAVDGDVLYRSVLGEGLYKNSDIIYTRDSYFLNAYDGGVLFANVNGEIVYAKDGNTEIIREHGAPLYLTLNDSYLYFLEGCIKRINIDGSNMINITEEGLSDAPFYIANNKLYYIGSDRLLYVKDLQNQEAKPVPFSNTKIGKYAVADDETIFFTPFAFDNSIWITDGKQYKLATDETKFDKNIRFVFISEKLYLIREPENKLYNIDERGKLVLESEELASYVYEINGELETITTDVIGAEQLFKR